MVKSLYVYVLRWKKELKIYWAWSMCYVNHNYYPSLSYYYLSTVEEIDSEEFSDLSKVTKLPIYVPNP